MSNDLPTVVLVDDHPLWRETLRKLLEKQGAGRVVAEADDGDAAVTTVVDTQPDVVVMDVDMPGCDGVEATGRILEILPDVRVLMLSAFDERSKVLRAVEAGARGYLLKTAGAAEVAAAVRQIADGGVVFPSDVADVLLGAVRGDRGGSNQLAAAGAAAATDDAPGEVGRFVREGEFWTLEFEGEVTRVGSLNGMHDLAVLLARPGAEVLASDLVAARSGAVGSHAASSVAQDGLAAYAGTGTGPALDATAKRQYRARMDELRQAVEVAEQDGDAARAASARSELEFLASELGSAVGLGGRDRPDNSEIERARISVTRGIRRAIQRIGKAHPALGRHLDRSVQTGNFCVYDPERPVEWELA